MTPTRAKATKSPQSAASTKGASKTAAKKPTHSGDATASAPAKGAGSPPGDPRVGVKEQRRSLEITPAMKRMVKEGQKMISDGFTKAEASREVFAELKGHSRKQVVWVFVNGCGLSAAGAGTYFQNCRVRSVAS